MADGVYEIRMILEHEPHDLDESEGEDADGQIAISDDEQQAGDAGGDANAGPSAAGEEGAHSDADKDASDA